jgi:hypothetical protein
MKKIFDARLYIYSIGLIVSSSTERIITSIITRYISLESISYHALSLVILVILFILTNILLKPFTQKEFITKIVLGKKYIGGRWVEIVITENNEISHITKIDITYDDDKINIHGDCFQKNGQYKYCLDSICTSMDNYDLAYLYIAKEGMKSIREDMGHLRFEPNIKKKLNKYSGHFNDKGKEFKIAAILIRDKSVIKKMEDDFIGTVEQEVLPRLIKIHRLDIPEVINS